MEKNKKATPTTRAKIIRVDKESKAVELPEEFLRELGLIPGSEVEIRLEKDKGLIVIKPLGEDPFIEHFKDSMESMA